MNKTETTQPAMMKEALEAGGRITDYDTDSVMNYCNPRWNNDGKLSRKDVEGIQTLYGAKIVNSQGQVSISDELGKRQVWENVIVDLDGRGSHQFFHVDRSATHQIRAWNIVTGTYCYKVWGYTAFDDGLGRFGYSEGCVNLQGGSNYSFNLVTTRWNPNGYFNLVLRAVVK